VAIQDASTMWVEWYDLTWRRQVTSGYLTLPRMACLLYDLRTTCEKFSILSREDCLDHVQPSESRSPVPCVGTRVVLDVKKYIQYLEDDAKHIRDKREQLITASSTGYLQGDDGGYNDTPVEVPPLMFFNADLDDSCSRAHEVMPSDAVMDCVVSNIVSRGGGGSPYCLFYLIPTAIDENMREEHDVNIGSKNTSNSLSSVDIELLNSTSSSSSAAAANFRECRICVPGSGKPHGHLGRHKSINIGGAFAAAQTARVAAEERAKDRFTVKKIKLVKPIERFICKGCQKEFPTHYGLYRHEQACTDLLYIKNPEHRSKAENLLKESKKGEN
jgi:hypothetical protein